MRASGSTARAALAWLRDRAGHKHTPAEIAAAVKLPVRIVSQTLGRQFNDYRYVRVHLHREQVSDGRAYLYWFEPPATQESEGDAVQRKIHRFLRRHPQAMRPSQIAKALSVDVRAVTRVLLRWANDGTAVRCELLTRAGADRFEYRLSAADARLLTTISERRPVGYAG